MPQLNPSPWLMIFLFGWFVFLTIIPGKVLKHTFLKEPVSRSTTTLKTTPWSWQWH